MPRRRRSAGAALAAALVLSSAEAAESLKVMSFNLRYATSTADTNTWKQWDHPDYSPQRRAYAARLIGAYQPDVAGFQEGEDPQLDYLAAHTPTGYAYERQLPSGGQGTENAAFAFQTNKLELLDRGVFALGPSPGGGYWNNPPGTNFAPFIYFAGLGLNCPRLVLWGHFRWRATGQEFFFYTTHMDWNTGPQVSSATLIADDALARAGRRPASPLAIVVGDFNSTQSDNAWKLFTGTYTNNGIRGDFTDSWYQVKGTWTDSGTIHGYAGGTQPAANRIDWILHRGGFVATQFVILTDATVATNMTTHATVTMYPSDHYPVLATLRWPDPPADHDRDGLPDALEAAATNLLPADADTDNDLLLDGEEDLDGDGQLDGGETAPQVATATQRPTDLRDYAMDGLRDHRSRLLGSNGMDLYYAFDGRYLYVATQDAGEGSDHFIFVARNPVDTVAMPWAKGGQVARWSAYLADENDNGYVRWFDAAGAALTDPSRGRAATYYQNGGWLEGVVDLAAIFGPGFTNAFYLAAGPWGTADGGTIYPAAQVPAGNGDSNLAGAEEFFRLEPGDRDHDGISDPADPDADGDGLPDTWETAYGLNPSNAVAADGAAGDFDGDGMKNLDEYLACTAPADSNDLLRILAVENDGARCTVRWPSVQKKTYTIHRATQWNPDGSAAWASVHTNPAAANLLFPCVTNAFSATVTAGDAQGYFRVRLAP